jgi:hypothetical protein
MPSKFVEYVQTHAPHCLAGIMTRPSGCPVPAIEFPNQFISPRKYSERETSGIDTVAFHIGCTCGCFAVYLLGFNKLSEHGKLPIFVGPLSIECPECGAVTEFFDTRKHGYDGEQGVNTHITGTGKPDRFACASCRSLPMSIYVRFTYSGVDRFRGEMQARPQDFFETLDVVVQCTGCNVAVEVISFECA